MRVGVDGDDGTARGGDEDVLVEELAMTIVRMVMMKILVVLVVKMMMIVMMTKSVVPDRVRRR